MQSTVGNSGRFEEVRADIEPDAEEEDRMLEELDEEARPQRHVFGGRSRNPMLEDRRDRVAEAGAEREDERH